MKLFVQFSRVVRLERGGLSWVDPAVVCVHAFTEHSIQKEGRPRLGSKCGFDSHPRSIEKKGGLVSLPTLNNPGLMVTKQVGVTAFNVESGGPGSWSLSFRVVKFSKVWT